MNDVVYGPVEGEALATSFVNDRAASDQQSGGGHYKNMPIEPAEFCQKNRIPWCEANAIKYLVRHRHKNGIEDLMKAQHYINLLIEWEYTDGNDSRREGNQGQVKDARQVS